MDRQHLAQCLEFHDDSILDEHVDSAADVDPDFVVQNGQVHLREDLEPAFAELVREAGVIGALQQTLGLLGLIDSLLPSLRRCVDGPWSKPAWFMAREPEMASVRHDPRVAALLSELWADRKSVLRP